MGNWQLDPYHTQVEFSAKHLGMMTVRGTFDELSATADIDPDHPEAASVEVHISTWLRAPPAAEPSPPPMRIRSWDAHGRSRVRGQFDRIGWTGCEVRHIAGGPGGGMAGGLSRGWPGPDG